MSIHSLLENYVLLVAIISWVTAQIAKTFVNFYLTNKIKAERLLGAGGMPSSHTATVCSVAVAVSRKTGVSSVEFAIALVLALVVMYDAMGVRRQSGEHAKLLNMIIDELKEDKNLKNEKLIEFTTQLEQSEEEKKLTEYIGHTPFEVLAGALLGILIAMIIPVS